MAGENDRNLRHLFIEGRTIGIQFTNPSAGGGGGETFPKRDRATHAERIIHQLDAIRNSDDAERASRTVAGLPTDYGLVLEFAGRPGFPLESDCLERRGKDILLLNVRTLQTTQPGGQTKPQEFATVRVPFGRLGVFEKLVEEYRDAESKPGSCVPKNQPLVASIEAIRKAALDAFWTDPSPMPNAGETVLWEAWLRAGESAEERAQIIDQFRAQANHLGIAVVGRPLFLPETSILLVRAAREQLQASVELLDCLSELRAPAVGAAEFDDMNPADQADWVKAAVSRLQAPATDAPAVCLLDTGVPPNGVHAYLPAWGTDDRHENGIGHGTQMAGLAAFGDLTASLLASSPIQATHWIESGKILNDAAPQPADQWGNIVVDTVAAVEQAAPVRRRIFAQQVSAENSCFDGRPTSWSSATDQLCAAAGEDPAKPRLVFVSAGNWPCENAADYPVVNREKSIHDPAQAWNVVTVGACTHKDHIREPSRSHLTTKAPRGALSPMSTTSCVWNDDWPIKPEIVFEGGNRFEEGGQLWKHPDLELLTTNAAFTQRLLTTADGTSAASVQAARLAALIQREYPGAWPETIRALVVHSAEWSYAMHTGRNMKNKSAVAELLRNYGHGEPDAMRALRTAKSAVTLIVQDELQPFAKVDGGYATNEMRFHTLPWPLDALHHIGTANVEMRATLSYFIEPNPGPRLTNNRYRYGSCHLRFDVQRPTESIEGFRARINAEDRPGQTWMKGGDSDRWQIGSDTRHRGSIHQDTWRGSAADLASKPCVAVYPVNGWWRLRQHLKRYDSRLRYSLVVSLRSPEQPVDLYTPIAQQLALPVPVPTT